MARSPSSFRTRTSVRRIPPPLLTACHSPAGHPPPPLPSPLGASSPSTGASLDLDPELPPEIRRASTRSARMTRPLRPFHHLSPAPLRTRPSVTVHRLSRPETRRPWLPRIQIRFRLHHYFNRHIRLDLYSTLYHIVTEHAAPSRSTEQAASLTVDAARSRSQRPSRSTQHFSPPQ
ncbi:hypothetical protein B0H12DRAFT_1241982 [Mycena haematopus]|nr:hypothetical protein B0H12DRAFT_1241982 [Mycena haematopus]